MVEKGGLWSRLTRPSSAVPPLGQEAVRYALVLMDMHMPDMNGIEARQAIRRRELTSSVRTPIVAMTASITPDDHKNCLEAGMDDFLGKPVRLEALEAVLKRWVVEKRQYGGEE